MDYKWLSDPTVFNINRVEAHSNHKFSGCFKKLNGSWKMYYAKNLSLAPAEFWKEGFDLNGFDDVTVPLPIQMQGYGSPAYNNFMYPWDGHEAVKSGDVPKMFNPTASYVKEFIPEKEMEGQRVFVSFEGTESGMALWLNGCFIGYSEDSFTTHDFEITKQVKFGKVNRLAVQVYRFTSSSWLEDQDFFRFSGIFRDVTLYSVPKMHVFDIFAKAKLDRDNVNGTLDLELTLDAADAEKATAEISVKSLEEEIMKGEMSLIKGKNEKSFKVGEVAPWSAEYPNLYELCIVLKNEKGEEVETCTQNIGFRRFELENGILKLGKVTDFQCHMLEHQLGAYTDCNHGFGLSVIHPVLYRHIYKNAVSQFAKFAVNVWGVDPNGKTEDDVALEGINALADFIKEMGLPTTFSEMGITDTDLKAIADSTIITGGCCKKLNKEELLDILIECK